MGIVATIWLAHTSSRPARRQPPSRPPLAKNELRRPSCESRERNVKIHGRSSNLRVRKLADKLAKAFERDPSLLVAMLSDERFGGITYQAGRDLITLFPDRSAELLEAFKTVKPVELGANLCGDLIADVTIRLGGEQSLALADSLEPGSLRDKAFNSLADSLKPAEFMVVLEKTMAAGFPEDLRQLEFTLLNRAGNFPAKVLGELTSLDLSRHAGKAIRAFYGDQLVAEMGRQRAFEEALVLPAGQQVDVIQGILRSGSLQDQGASWLLDALSSLDPSMGLDRSALTIGVTQQMLNQNSSEAMDWAAEISDAALRDATVRGGIQCWLQLNSIEASAWLARQPDGPAKDSAISQMVRFLKIRGDSESARAWIGQMQNLQMRENAAIEIGSMASGDGPRN